MKSLDGNLVKRHLDFDSAIKIRYHVELNFKLANNKSQNILVLNTKKPLDKSIEIKLK